MEKKKREFDFFDRPRNRRRLWIGLYGICGLTLVPEFLLRKTSHFGVEHFFGFYPLLGFVSCAVLILFSKWVGLFLKKKEGYYDG